MIFVKRSWGSQNYWRPPKESVGMKMRGYS